MRARTVDSRLCGVRCHSSSLGVRFPKSELNTVSTATKLVEHHRNRARVHVVVPIVPAKRIERSIHVVDTTIVNLDGVAILNPIFGHGHCPSIRNSSLGVSSAGAVAWPS